MTNEEARGKVHDLIHSTVKAHNCLLDHASAIDEDEAKEYANEATALMAHAHQLTDEIVEALTHANN